MKRWVWLVPLLAVGAGAQLPPGPEPFVELEPGGEYKLDTQALFHIPSGDWNLPVLRDQATDELVYDWTWRSRKAGGGMALPSVLPAPGIHSLICYESAHTVVQARDPSGRVWIAFVTGHPPEIGVSLARLRSPFEPRACTIPGEFPYTDPQVAEEFRRQLRALAQLQVTADGADGVPLLSEAAVKGLERYDVGPGEPDFPAPPEQRLAAAKEVWRLGAEMLNEAMARWQNPPFITSYGCIYASEQYIHGSGAWRDVILPPQVRQRIARLKDMPENDDRKVLRWEVNRVVLDYLVPCVGVASYVAQVFLPVSWFEHGRVGPWQASRSEPFEVVPGRDERGRAFDGASLWYGQGDKRLCVMAVNGDGECSYWMEEPKPAR